MKTIFKKKTNNQKKIILDKLLYEEEKSGEKRINIIFLCTAPFLICLVFFTSLSSSGDYSFFNYLGVSLFFVYHLFVYQLSKRGYYHWIVKYITMTINISIITLIIIGYAFKKGPLHTVRTVTVSTYFFCPYFKLLLL